MRESADHDKLLVNQRDARHAAYDLARVLVLRAPDLLAGDAALHHHAVLLYGDSRRFGVLLARGRDHSRAEFVGSRLHIYKEQGVGASGVDGECLLAVAQIGHRERIIALAGQFEAEQAFIVCERGASDLWQREGCADERVARFPVNDFSFQAESGCTQRQCNEQEGQQSP